MALSTLKERRLACEHASVLISHVDLVPVADLKLHIKHTQELWPKYPLALQVQICCRFVHSCFKDAALSFMGKRVEESKKHIDKLLTSLNLNVTPPTDESDVYSFDGESPCLAHALANVLAEASASHFAVEAEMDIDKLMNSAEDADASEGVSTLAKVTQLLVWSILLW